MLPTKPALSQWSLTFEVRKRGVGNRGGVPGEDVAMEPDL